MATETETGTFDYSFNGMSLSNKDLDLYDANNLPFSKTIRVA